MPGAKESILKHRQRILAEESMAPPADVNVKDMELPLHGDVKVPIRIYRPKGKPQDKYPTLFYIPGTGFIAQEINFTHVICSHLCEKANCQVIAIYHRLAPENQFPKGIRDVYGTFRALVSAPSSITGIGIDLENVVIVGYSSGGNFAALVAIQAKKAGLPLKRQILISPMVDLSRSLKEFKQFEEKDTAITEDFVRWVLKCTSLDLI